MQKRYVILLLVGLVLAGGVAGVLYWAISAGLLFSRPQSVAVLEFDLAGLAPSRSGALSLGQRLVEMITTLSSMNCKPAVILKDDLVRRGLLPRDVVITDKQAAAIGKELGVSRIIVGTATFTDGVFLAVRLLDARTGKRLAEAELSGKSSTEVRDRMGFLVYQLLGRFEKLRNIPPEAVLKLERSPLSTAQPVPHTTLF
ncbi:MAG: hypothetical protein N2320_03955, partial [Candidatus Bipolaricaulota bacterium]|nr:hypothetical protein [Candidatus Bipolaricaulota bacterium]